MKFYLEISYDLFFWTTIRGDRRGQSRKSGDFDQNTRNGLKSSLLSFINRETVKIDGKFSIWFWDKKFFMVCTHPAPAYFVSISLWSLGNFCEDGCHRKPSIWSFFVYLWYMYVLNEKNLNALWVSTVIWSWPILTILTKITIFGYWFLLNQAFI